MESIRVCTLGEFSLKYGAQNVQQAGSRSRRVWALLAYLLCHRGQVITQHKLIELLWDSQDDISSPENALRLVLHRARALLDQLYPGAGKDCILSKEGGYCWNADLHVDADYERFEGLTQDSAERLPQLLQALALYNGEFLPQQADLGWVIPVSAHYQNLFLQLSQEAALLLMESKRYEEAVQTCRKAVRMEPYFEPIYQVLMRVLSAMGNPRGAAEVYEDLSRRLFDDFGIRPSEETRAVYRAAAHSSDHPALSMDTVLEHLQESDMQPGALLCDYDYFKMLCFAERRAIERTGTVTHVALLSLVGKDDQPLSKRSQSRIMEQLGQVLRTNLRRGDVISRCSVSQYIVMLPKANYENSCMVCRRLIAAFTRAHPHTAAKLHFLVQPLTPGTYVP